MIQKGKKQNVGILGFGEIGQAIAKFYVSPKIKDLKRDDGLVGVDILHVCIPYSGKFCQIVKQNIAKIKPKLVIVHSTLPLGVTARLGKDIVHSPCRGVHPALFQGIKTFVKYFGAVNMSYAALAAEHFKSLGVPVRFLSSCRETEALKLWDTTYYGLNIIYNKEVADYCYKNNLDFDEVYTHANQTYNLGYAKLGMEHVRRPVLNYMTGPIGGHCVIPNCKLLRGRIPRFILNHQKTAL